MTQNLNSNESAAELSSAKKDYYKKLITDHKTILAHARSLIGVMLSKLEVEINEFDIAAQSSDAKKLEAKFWWGDKENASTILTRLTTLLLKIIPMEQEIARLDLTKADILEMEEAVQNTRIAADDLKIIEEYIQRYSEEKMDE